MKVIAIPCYNRPDHLTRCLDAIAVAATHSSGWSVRLHMEPGQPTVQAVIARFAATSGLPTVGHVNQHRLGCHQNTFNVCHAAIENGADAILSYDDDVVVSPDGLALCDWYLSNQAYQDTAVNGGLALCRKDGNDPARQASLNPNETWLGHLGQGHCYSSAVWHSLVAPHWWDRRPEWKGGPDWSICAMAVELGRRILRPRLARTQHVGATGYHEESGLGLGVFPEVIATCDPLAYLVEDQ